MSCTARWSPAGTASADDGAVLRTAGRRRCRRPGLGRREMHTHAVEFAEGPLPERVPGALGGTVDIGAFGGKHGETVGRAHLRQAPASRLENARNSCPRARSSGSSTASYRAAAVFVMAPPSSNSPCWKVKPVYRTRAGAAGRVRPRSGTHRVRTRGPFTRSGFPGAEQG